MIIKKLISLSILTSSLLFGGNISINDNMLKKEQKDIITTQYIQNKKNNTYNNFSWINDVNLKLDVSRTDKGYTRQNYGIYFDQPIFKSGNILRAINVSNDIFKLQNQQNKYSQRQLVLKVVDLILKIQATYISGENINKQLEANSIEQERKNDLYKSGLLDISFVSDNLIMKNNLLNLSIDVQSKRFKLKENLKKYTNLKYDELIHTYSIKSFTHLMTEEEYLNDNVFNLDKKSLKIQQQKTNISKYSILPTISIYANATKVKFDKQEQFRENFSDDYIYGMRINIPIGINKFNNFEIEKSKLLTQNDEFILKQKNAKITYQQQAKQIYFLYQKIKNVEKTIHEYNKLIDNLKDDLKDGIAVKSDIKLLIINKVIKNIEKENIENQIKQLILQLHFDMLGEQ